MRLARQTRACSEIYVTVGYSRCLRGCRRAVLSQRLVLNSQYNISSRPWAAQEDAHAATSYHRQTREETTNVGDTNNLTIPHIASNITQ